MRFLITGGAGFLGSALANRLVSDGQDVRVLDDLSNGDRNSLNASVHFTRGDVNDIPLLWTMLQDVDCVYHLGARVSVAQSVLYPRDYNHVNVGGTVSLMQDDQPVRESDPPKPDSPYAVSKWASENYVHTIGQLWGIETVALRIFNAFGPGQQLPVSHAPVVPGFMNAVLTGGSIVIYGDGEQSRDFIFVDDVVDALVNAATAMNISRKVINIGSGNETSVKELASLIEAVAGRKAARVWNRQKTGGVKRLVADIAMAREYLGFRPSRSLADALRLTLEMDPRFGGHIKN